MKTGEIVKRPRRSSLDFRSPGGGPAAGEGGVTSGKWSMAVTDTSECLKFNDADNMTGSRGSCRDGTAILHDQASFVLLQIAVQVEIAISFHLQLQFFS